jgi:hypothetical protein
MSDDGAPVDASVPVPRASVEWVELDGEAVLHDSGAGTLHRLNPTAAVVWAHCDGSRSVAEIVRLLQRAHPGADDAIGRDVRGLMERLRRLHLIALVAEARLEP